MAAEWYYAEQGQQRGPLSFEELQALAAAGRLRPNDLVWHAGLTEWILARPGLRRPPALPAAAALLGHGRRGQGCPGRRRHWRAVDAAVLRRGRRDRRGPEQQRALQRTHLEPENRQGDALGHPLQAGR